MRSSTPVRTPQTGAPAPSWWDVISGAADPVPDAAVAAPLPARPAADPSAPADGPPGPRPAAAAPGPVRVRAWPTRPVAGPGGPPTPRAGGAAAPGRAAPGAPACPAAGGALASAVPSAGTGVVSSVVRVSALRPPPARVPRAGVAPAVVTTDPARGRPAPPAAQPDLPEPAAPATGPSPAGAPELVLTDGRRIAVRSTVLLGRAPAPAAGETVGARVTIADPGRAVSRTHLLVGVDGDGVWVLDRRSTNGTLVTQPDGHRTVCAPGRPVRLEVGASVDFGDHGFTLAGPQARG